MRKSQYLNSYCRNCNRWWQFAQSMCILAVRDWCLVVNIPQKNSIFPQLSTRFNHYPFPGRSRENTWKMSTYMLYDLDRLPWFTKLRIISKAQKGAKPHFCVYLSEGAIFQKWGRVFALNRPTKCTHSCWLRDKVEMIWECGLVWVQSIVSHVFCVIDSAKLKPQCSFWSKRITI